MVAYRLDYGIGDWIDNEFKIVQKIGSGSYGDVFKVNSIEGNTYALKLLRLWEVPMESYNELVKRFHREYETAKLPSEYLVHSFNYREVEGNPYYTMELCENGVLSNYVDKDLTSLPLLAHDILSGLYYLHSEGMVHRDLKPENVLIRANGKAALTDFGVVGDKDPNKSLTKKNLLRQPKQIFGTIAYMAPEMYERKGGGVTYLPTIDIFSFGVMIYEILADGHLPFGSNPEQYQNRVKRGIWDKNELIARHIDSLWVSVIQRCIESDYRNRYQNAYEIIKDLRPLIGHTNNRLFVENISRSSSISQLVITQGQNIGSSFHLDKLLKGHAKMIKIGRGELNDLILLDDNNAYISRYHFTLEKSAIGSFWIIRDGQWRKDMKRWVPSTNGTFLNATPVTTEGLKVFTGDIITIGEYKIKIQ